MTTAFVGTNSRSLASFLNSNNSDIRFIKNPKKNSIFAMLSDDTAIAVSQTAQEFLTSGASVSLADFQVVDMPSDDGGIFPLICKASSNNVVATLCR